MQKQTEQDSTACNVIEKSNQNDIKTTRNMHILNADVAKQYAHKQ